MKRKRPQRAERRRSMPEIDLIEERKPKVPAIPTISRRGCAQLFGQVLVLVLLVAGGAVLAGVR